MIGYVLVERERDEREGERDGAAAANTHSRDPSRDASSFYDGWHHLDTEHFGAKSLSST